MSPNNSNWHTARRDALLWGAIIAAWWIVAFTVNYILYRETITEWFENHILKVQIMATAAPFIAILYYSWLHLPYLNRKRYLTYALLLLPFAAVIAVLNFLSFLPGYIGHFHVPYAHRWILGNISQSFIVIYLPFILFYTAVKSVQAIKIKRQALEQERDRTTLLLLKNQLEPHFLFNTLNAAYATAQREHAHDTRAGIEELAAVLRYATATADKERVSAGDELKFAEQYLYLARMCNGGAKDITATLSWDRKEAYIAPMLLQPIADHIVNSAPVASIPASITISDKQLTADMEGSAANDLASLGQRLEMEYNGRHTLNEQNGRLQLNINLA